MCSQDDDPSQHEQIPAFFTEPPAALEALPFAARGTPLDPVWTHHLGGDNWYDESQRIFRTSEGIDTITMGQRALGVPMWAFALCQQKVDWVEFVSAQSAWQAVAKSLINDGFAAGQSGPTGKGVMYVLLTIDRWRDLSEIGN
jgi:hypothetical protein